MPAVLGHELPTPGNADSPKQRKHREQVIVLSTLALVILTYILVMRHGSSAAVDSQGQFTPTDTGGGTAGGSDPTLPGMIAGIPGQVAALEQGNASKEGRQITRLRRRANNLSKRLKHQSKTNHRQAQRIGHLQHEVHNLQPHPKHPKHATHETHRTRHHSGEHWVGAPVHPPQHGGKKNQHDTTIPFGALHHY